MPHHLIEVEPPLPRRRPTLRLINTVNEPVTIETRSPDDALYQSPRFHKLHRRNSYARERRPNTAMLCSPATHRATRSAGAIDYYKDDTQEQLARFYQRQALEHRHHEQHQHQHEHRALEHRPRHQHQHPHHDHQHQHQRDHFALALVPVHHGEVVRHAKPVVLERDTPRAHRPRHEKQVVHVRAAPAPQPAVIERKQVKYLRDTDGGWMRVRKVVR